MTKEGLKSIIDNERWGFTLRFMALKRLIKICRIKK